MTGNGTNETGDLAGDIERATATTVVAATVADCFEVGIAVEAYPEWVEGITSVEVLSRDEARRPLEVRFVAQALGRTAEYTLRYDLSEAPNRLSWTLIKGDVARKIDGSYRFAEVDAPETGQSATQVDYELEVDVLVPMPGFVKRRAEDKIVESALGRFQNRVEGLRST